MSAALWKATDLPRSKSSYLHTHRSTQPGIIQRRRLSKISSAATSPENYDHQLQYAVDASPVHQNAAQAPPFLIMHGTGDRMVPPEQSAALHTHLVQAGRQSTLVLIEGFGHGFLNPGEVAELGPNVRLDNGRLEREPQTNFSAQQSPGNPFELQGLAADHEMIKRFFTLHLR